MCAFCPCRPREATPLSKYPLKVAGELGSSSLWRANYSVHVNISLGFHHLKSTSKLMATEMKSANVQTLGTGYAIEYMYLARSEDTKIRVIMANICSYLCSRD